jgi:DMSO/TMAO reductase YedYZ heme-binding membrane subunit
MTTVGYGDFFPVTYLCKVVGVVCAFWGVYITSLFVNSVTAFLKSDESESRAYLLLNSVEEKRKL